MSRVLQQKLTRVPAGSQTRGPGRGGGGGGTQETRGELPESGPGLSAGALRPGQSL